MKVFDTNEGALGQPSPNLLLHIVRKHHEARDVQEADVIAFPDTSVAPKLVGRLPAFRETILTSVTPTGDGKDIVVFDIDETALSNLPYYREHKYEGEAFNHTPFNLWVEEGTAPAVPAILQLFNALKAAKFGVVFLTGRSESQRDITTKNLYRAGYNNWTELILKSPEESGTTAVVYKSKKRTELASKGYYIYSSVGDQWSDITGPYVGNRTFKVPNPMYFIA